MKTWFIEQDRLWQFKFGVEDFLHAQHAAKACGQFVEDDEDEQTDNVPLSCYNCMYRRWEVDSFKCYRNQYLKSSAAK
ncbi:hypothetical protein ACFOD0_13275 [Shewanella intestini]|uniref:Uncharacterized protein n=1 Tax=Shewanella intestini TaxID=2017544 RepID=A0ABS5I063_9GAMM|nr:MULTISPECIES: hypothetical protein [Shewanella]MBR9727311.1 hypothetical protein [Shewanella intestini]MRG35639.1 hypothetical protein [Shewanella sp. XMDDZSB0408]